MTRHEIDFRTSPIALSGPAEDEGFSPAVTWLVVLELSEALFGAEPVTTRATNVVVHTEGKPPTADEIHRIEESAQAYHGALSAKVTFFAKLGD